MKTATPKASRNGHATGPRSLPMSSIVRSPTNPRKHFDEAKLQELADSIQAKGVLQPILVRPRPSPSNGQGVMAEAGDWLSTLHGFPADVAELLWREKQIKTAGQLRDAAAGNVHAFIRKIPGSYGPSALAATQMLARHLREADEFDGPAAEGETYELVAGERRWRACKLAGLPEIPAIVLALSDKEVCEVQVIENEQREDVSPLEKADGYQRLLSEHGLTIEDIAGRVGKSPSTIRGLVKLLDLPEPARLAVEAGRLPASTAQLIARVPGKEARAEVALRVLSHDPFGQFHNGALADRLEEVQSEEEDPLSYREAQDMIETRYMVELKKAPFSRKALDLVDSAGSCDACPKRTGNDPASYPGSRADVCTDPACYRAKVQAHGAALERKAIDVGLTVMAPEVVAKEFWGGRLRYDSPYLAIDDVCEQDAKKRTYRKMLSEAVLKTVAVAIDKEGGQHHLVLWKMAEGDLKKAGLKSGSNRGSFGQGGSEKFRKEQAAERKKAEQGGKAALQANGLVAETLESIFGQMRGFPQAHIPKLQTLVVALAEVCWSDAARRVAKRRRLTTKGADGNGPREAIARLAGEIDSFGKLLGLAAELVAARMSLDWGKQCGRDEALEKQLWQAFSIDKAKLLKDVK